MFKPDWTPREGTKQPVDEIAALRADATDEQIEQRAVDLRYGLSPLTRIKAVVQLAREFAAARVAEKDAEIAALREDAARLDFLLRDAMLTITEDGNQLGLFLGVGKTDQAVLIVAEATGDSSEESFTVEDVPFLTPEQRDQINGCGSCGDRAAIRAAIDAARAASAKEG